MPVKSYQELIAWQKAMDLAEAVYRETRVFPREELYGLTSQLRRAVTSIASNIAEGQGRSTKDFGRFLCMAMGSKNEVETQLILAARLEYLGTKERDALLNQTAEVGRVVNGLLNSLNLTNTD